MCITNLAPWLQMLQGLLTPVIGLTTVYIAWQQWRTNERKLRLDQYERRLKIYQQVVDVLILICSDFKPEFQQLLRFRSACAEADFLFQADIPAYLDEIVKRGLLLRKAHAEDRDFTQPAPASYDHQKVVDEMHEQERWFIEQPPVAKSKFMSYLRVSH